MVVFLLTNLNPDSVIKIRFSVPFRDKPILDCNLNDPHPKVDHSDWYLSPVSDCAFHLAN